MRIRIKIILSLCIIGLFVGSAGHSQESLMNIRVEEDPGQGIFGQNKKHFIEARTFYGLYFADQMNTRHHLKYSSYDAEVFIRYKKKISPVLGTGLSLSLLQTQFNYKHPEDTGLELPDRDRIRMTGIKPGAYIRINFDPKRGNFTGKYIDAGVYLSYAYNLKRIMITYPDEENSAFRKSKEELSGLSYLNRMKYGVYVSLGLGSVELSYRYRISPIMKGVPGPGDPRIDYINMDYPAHNMGISYRIASF